MSRHEHSILVRVRVTAGQPAGSVFVPMHFSAAYASRAELNALIPAITDPISGQPAGKRCRSFAYLLIASGLLLVTTSAVIR